MKAYIINEHDFVSNFTIINTTTAKRNIDQVIKPEQTTANTDLSIEKTTHGIDAENKDRDSDGESKQEAREKVEQNHTRERLKERARELRNKNKLKRRLNNRLY